MAYTPREVTEGELKVLHVLWDRGTATIRQLTELIHPRGGAAQYATVQKMLDRLEAKGYVRRDRSLHVQQFSATVDRGGFISRQLRALARSLCGGSTAPLLSHLVRDEPLTEKERATLDALIERLGRKSDEGDARG